MLNSYAEYQLIPCPHCNTTMGQNVWLLVDMIERPDLAGFIRDGSLHQITCLSCGKLMTLNTPLLLYWPNGISPLFFASSTILTAEENHQRLSYLLSVLRNRIGNAWRDDWLQRGLHTCTTIELPGILAKEPQTKAHRISEISNLQKVINKLIYAQGTESAREIVEAHPELLTDEADELFEQFLEIATEANDPIEEKTQVILKITSIRNHLNLCRKEGVSEAFSSLAKGNNSIETEELKTLLNKFAESLVSNDLNGSIDIAQDILQVISLEKDPKRWAFMHQMLGGQSTPRRS